MKQKCFNKSNVIFIFISIFNLIVASLFSPLLSLATNTNDFILIAKSKDSVKYIDLETFQFQSENPYLGSAYNFPYHLAPSSVGGEKLIAKSTYDKSLGIFLNSIKNPFNTNLEIHSYKNEAQATSTLILKDGSTVSKKVLAKDIGISQIAEPLGWLSSTEILVASRLFTIDVYTSFYKFNVETGKIITVLPGLNNIGINKIILAPNQDVLLLKEKTIKTIDTETSSVNSEMEISFELDSLMVIVNSSDAYNIGNYLQSHSNQYPTVKSAFRFLYWPIPSNFQIGCDFYGCYEGHKGIDMDVSDNDDTPIYAAESGTVVAIENTKVYGFERNPADGYGNFVKIQHSNGYYTIYAHLTKSLRVGVGENVKVGQLLGYSSNSGYTCGYEPATSGCGGYGGTWKHLHFEVRDSNENYLNPHDYLLKNSSGSYISALEAFPINLTGLQKWINSYGSGVGGWDTSRYIRTSADVNGDGSADIVAFGEDGVFVSLSKKTTYSNPVVWHDNFAYADGWRVEKHPRMVADVNGDKKTDIVGFGEDGVFVALSDGTKFGNSIVWSDNFAFNDTWSTESHIRTIADVNGDGKGDIVGMGHWGTDVALSDGTKFGAPTTWHDNFAYMDGWRVETNPRVVTDVNGDRKADVIGFGADGVFVSLSDGTKFGNAVVWHDSFGVNDTWSVDSHVRTIADVNGDGRGDIVGIGHWGTEVALSDGTKFGVVTTWHDNFAYMDGWRVETNPRVVTDVNGDRKADVIGFANDGVYVASSNGRRFVSNRIPTNPSLSTNRIAENKSIGTTVGVLSSTDVDSGETFTYTLVSGTGSTDNNSFSISGNTLKTTKKFNYEVKNSYSIRIRTTDSKGLYFEKVFKISVTNVNEAPTKAKTPAPANGSINMVSTTTLKWVASTDPEKDTVKYDVYLGTSATALKRVSLNQTTLTFKPTLKSKTKYFWRIDAKDSKGLVTKGSVWNFTTK
jgi:murein DD-endopeptidase MepM/ murein hydrolase activator NlpD